MKIEGVIPALLTPFTEGGQEVDYEKACALAVRLADKGVHGVFVGGTTGEGPLLRLEERKRLLEEVLGAAGAQIKVVAHTGCFDTASTIELTRHAADAGAPAAGVIAPGFFGYDDASLEQHYCSIAAAVPGFPVLMYNLPGCAKNKLSASLILKLAESVDNIVGLKDSSGDLCHLNEVLGGAPAGFAVINGTDGYTFQALMGGASGCVTSTGNAYPELFLDIYNAVRAGEYAKAWETQVRLSKLCKLFGYGAMISTVKEALRMQGFDAGRVRAPQRELNDSEKASLKKGLVELGLL